MAGGSVLEARWRHRRSTDIDLFVSPATMEKLVGENSLLYQGLVSQLDASGNAAMDSFNGFLSGEMEGTSFSLAASEFVRDDRTHPENVDGTHFQAATNEEILAGKIRGRLHRSGQHPAQAPLRDLYDITVAPHLEPGVVDRILGGQPEGAHCHCR